MSTENTSRQNDLTREAAVVETVSNEVSVPQESGSQQTESSAALNLGFSSDSLNDQPSVTSTLLTSLTPIVTQPSDDTILNDIASSSSLSSASGLVSETESAIDTAVSVPVTAAENSASYDTFNNGEQLARAQTVVVNAVPVLTIDPISGDNAVSYAEGIYGLVLSGHAQGLPADTQVQVTLANHSFSSLINPDGTWQVSLTDTQLAAITDGIYTVAVTASDSSGQQAQVSSNVTLITHLSSIPTVTFNNVTSDNVINIAESQHSLLLSGHLSTHGAPGETLTIASAGGLDSMKEYQANIHSNGNWCVRIPAADMANFIDGEEHRLIATTSDAAGNHSQADFNFTTQLSLPEIYYELDIGGDLTLSAQEAQHDLSFYIDGIQNISINGKTYEPHSGMVTISSADLLALPDGPVNATVHQADSYGNSATHTLDNFFTVATHTPAVAALSVTDLGLQHHDDGLAAYADTSSQDGGTVYYQPPTTTLADMLVDQHLQTALV